MPIIDFDFDTEADALRAKAKAVGSVYAYEQVDGRYWHEKQLTIPAKANLYGNITVDGTTYVGTLISAASEITAAATQIAALKATLTASATLGGEYRYGDGRAFIPKLVSFGTDYPTLQGLAYLGPFTSEAYSSSFIPLKTTVGYGYLLGLTSYGLAIEPQVGEGYLNALTSKGWARDATEDEITETGDGLGYLNFWFGYGQEGSRLEPMIYDFLYQIPFNFGLGRYNETATSTLNLTSVLTDLLAAGILVEEFSSDVTAASVFAAYGKSFEELISTLNLTSLTSALRAYTEQLTNSLSLASVLDSYKQYIEEFASTVTITDIYNLYRDVIAQYLDSLTFTTNFGGTVNFLATLNEQLSLDDYYSQSVAGIPAPLQSAIRTWAVNIENSASAQYDKYGFTSFAKYDDRHFAAAEDGIYVLTGSTDAGVPIDALVQFALSRFTTPQKKYFPSVYLGVTSSGKLLLKAVVDGQTWIYEANNDTANMANQRIDLGRGLSGSHWQFTLLNQDGDDFDLESVEFLPFISSRRVY